MLPCYVLLDLETTGGNAVRDRITEIAAVRFEHGVEVARWSTLVNPGVFISGFITQLTGISNALVADAPAFDQVGVQLLKLLDGAVLVAHNVRFDHGFLLHEFARMDVALRTKTLCTVRLSRLLYPGIKGHGLDAIMQRHGITTESRHRAMGDVQVMQTWLKQVAQQFGAAHLRQQALVLLQGSAALPPQLDTHVADIPEGPGVYIFYGEGTLPLYIGKSVKLRSRVMSHFSAASREPREMRIAQEIRRIEWVETAGELGALLLEARLVKKHQPLHNRQLRRESSLCAWRLDANPNARPLLTLVRGAELSPEQFGNLYGPYRSKNQAISHLRELADAHGLCLQALGLESGKGRCFAHQIGHCKGVCCGEEAPERHHLRLQMVLSADKLRVWPFAGPVGLREHNPHTGKGEMHIFNQWCHLTTVRSDEDLQEALQTRTEVLAFDLDSYRLALKYLMPPGKVGLTLIHLNSSSKNGF
ncbi:exonuclease domain-containing protein [Rhodoferax antarcticus]|uniref:Excinuclease cho n=1 Tax=Rhodoferax antarcticus ANT.BR TaxID=1111071 RepID=A0A1Q8YEK3_9BURK|nr:exonuclease domain-containing protein [Rhodoferax antarcticus]APW46124.1 DNA polymerase III subunit epsilon [Rhodoferax antarcticus]OLP06300.1 exonuclease, DNA polymerase III, epsilon subunit family domain protein [Rhodoferax antarcticus ANT.BR]